MHVVTIEAEFGQFTIDWEDGDLIITGTDFEDETIEWGDLDARSIALSFIADPYGLSSSTGMWPGGDELYIRAASISADDPEVRAALKDGPDAAAGYYSEILVNGEPVDL